MRHKLASSGFLQYRQGSVCFTALPLTREPPGFMLYLRRVGHEGQVAKLKIDRDALGDFLLIRMRKWRVPGDFEAKFSPTDTGCHLTCITERGVPIDFSFNYGQCANILAFVENELPAIFGWVKERQCDVPFDEPGFIYV